MAAVKKQVYNEQLMATVDYGNFASVKSVIRNLLRFENLAERGDTVATSVLVDIKQSLGLYKGKLLDVMTPKQQVVVVNVLILDKPQSEVADALGISQQGVSYLLNSGIKRVQKYFKTGEVTWKQLSDVERDYLLANYGVLPIRDIADKLQRSENSCRVAYHKLNEGGRR